MSRKIIGVTVGTPLSPTLIKEKIADVGYATKEFVQKNYQPKGEYLTEHQDISGLLPRTELEDAIEDALAEAKGSGEFDGQDGNHGERGTGILNTTTGIAPYTTAVGGVTPTYRIGLSTLKTQSKVDDVLIGDTVRYSYYLYPIIYVDDSYAYMGTRVNIRGATGSTGSNGADGKTPVLGTDYWTEADKEYIIQQVLSELGESVIGSVDGENNIILTGDLADGHYTLKYKDEAGNLTEIGTVTVGNAQDIIINLIDTVGYTDNVRYSASSHGTKDAAGYVCTGEIQIATGDILRTSGVNFDAAEQSFCNIACIPNTNPTGDSTVPTNSSDPTGGGNYFSWTIDSANNLTITGGRDISGVKLRLTGYGSGANLIVTKNQEIV